MEFLSKLAQCMCHGRMAMINKQVTCSIHCKTHYRFGWEGGVVPCIIFECRGVPEFIKTTSKLRKKSAQSSRWKVNAAFPYLF